MAIERLKQMCQKFVIEAGKNGRAKLAIKANVSESTVRDVLQGHVPLPHTCYLLALACEQSKAEAIALASELSEYRAKETA